MKKLCCLFLLSLLLGACSVFSSGLTDKDVKQYIQAYNNIADAAPELAKLKRENEAVSLLTCGPCLARLERAVQDAGYQDMKTFIAMDVRMHVTLRAYYYVLITELAGNVGQGVAAEDVCGIQEQIARSQDPKQMEVTCARLKTLTSYLDKLGAMAVQLAQKLFKAGDIKVIRKHADAIHAAFTNKKLPMEFFHGGGGHDD